MTSSAIAYRPGLRGACDKSSRRESLGWPITENFFERESSRLQSVNSVQPHRFGSPATEVSNSRAYFSLNDRKQSCRQFVISPGSYPDGYPSVCFEVKRRTVTRREVSCA